MQTVEAPRVEATFRCQPRGDRASCGGEMAVNRVWCPHCRAQQLRPSAPTPTGPLLSDCIVVDAASGQPIALCATVTAEAAGYVATLARQWATRNTKGRPRMSGLGDRQAMFGTLAPQPVRQRYGCNRSNVARNSDPASWQAIATECHDLLGQALPDVAAANVASAGDVADCWKWAGTGWTSGVLNLTQALAYHRDAGNLNGNWSAMICARSNVGGGHLYLPEYDVTLDASHRTLIAFCGSTITHGVTPMTVGRTGWRVTAVFYGLRFCRECADSPEAELLRATRRSTQLNRAIASGEAKILTARRDDEPPKEPTVPPVKTEAERLDDLVEFARLMVASGDLEPWAALLRQLYTEGNVTREEALWLVALYNTYDSLGSAWAVFNRWRTPDAWAGALDRDEAAKYECTQERRNLRGGLVLRRLAHYAHLLHDGSQEAWLAAGLLTGRPGADFIVMCNHLRQVWGVGRQSAFEWAEFLAKVCDFPVTATNAMLWESEGPRRALQRLYGEPFPTPRWLDQRAIECKSYLAARGVDLSWEDFETVICDFNVGRDGRYYVGRHLAALREEINGATDNALLDAAWWATVPEPWCHIPPGIDKAKLPIYRDTGTLLDAP